MAVDKEVQIFQLLVGVACPTFRQVLTVSKRCAVCLMLLIHDVNSPLTYSTTKLNILFSVSAILILFFQFLTT
jgi:hypothetical protein